FSSRRRHTRSKRDWSSDVCSSDLVAGPHAQPPAAGRKPDQWHQHQIKLLRRQLIGIDRLGNAKMIGPGFGIGLPAHKAHVAPLEIGRASCRERGEKTESDVWL